MTLHPFLIRIRQQVFQHIDMPLFWITFTIMAIGVLTVFSATYIGGHSSKASGQMINLLVAVIIMWVVARIPPHKLMNMALPLYVIGVVLLVLVFLFGIKVNGARRWLSLGFVRIQPSELLKIAVPLTLAWYFHIQESRRKLSHYAVATLLMAIPFVLIAKQPDLGTALLVGAAGFYVIFLAGLPWKIMGGLLATALASAPFLWNMLHDYQRQRILTLIDPTSDPLGSGYHIIQSTIAIGSGGIIGKGWLNGTQTHLEFIPEKHTDFIFAVYSEEWGLIGNIALLVLYTLLIGRSMMIAVTAPTIFSRLLAGNIGLMFFTYTFVNMGMVAGILPVVGVPLPFMSYGGTALVTLFLGVGMLMSIQTHRMLVKR